MSIIKDVDETTYTATDTVLYTTDEMGETVLIKEVDYLSDGPPHSFVIQTKDKEQPQFAASSLLQLSQMKEDEDGTAVVVHQDSVVEIPGQEGYVSIFLFFFSLDDCSDW